MMDTTNNKAGETILNGSFGKILRDARESKGLTLDQVSEALFIKTRQLQAIENEDFEGLPENAFSRGFVANYAKFLKLDYQQIVNKFDESYPEELKPTRLEDIEAPLRPMGTLQRDENSRRIKINPLLLIATLAVLALAMFLFKTVNKAETEVNSIPTQTEETISEQEQQQGASVTQNTAAIGSSGSALNLGVDSNTDNQVTSNQATTNNSTQLSTESVLQSAEGNDSIEFWIRANTNVNVVDANGKQIMSGIHSRGGYTVKGTAPFKVNIENVENVKINLNKQPIKLAQYSKDNKANFELK